MRYQEFESIISTPRMNRYLTSCANDTRKSMTLYRLNLKLSQEFFTIISCFEIALRNKIDSHCTANLGNNWLQNAAQAGGAFDIPNCYLTKNIINDAINKLGANYSHHKLVAELGFGFWRYMFASHQYVAVGRRLLHIFSNKPSSTPALHYNSTYIFNELAKINKFRNRIAHHEPICFQPHTSIKESVYARNHYDIIVNLFQWMDINETDFLYGLDHINRTCNQLDIL